MLKMLKMLDEDIEERKNPKESCTPCRYRYLQNRNRRNTSFPHARPPSRAFRTVRSRAAATVRSRAAATCARSHSRHCCSARSIEATRKKRPGAGRPACHSTVSGGSLISLCLNKIRFNPHMSHKTTNTADKHTPTNTVNHETDTA